ncbi:MAG TPA: acyl-CoA dehydrogenase family protein [Acidimicrobiales bacterium]|jgi:alkylation response protein AidB-like acyl-CoA dehydrogenase
MSTADIESLDAFRQRARSYLRDTMPPARPARSGAMSDEEELAEIEHSRMLQRLLFDGGLAGILFPKEYGGQGLTEAHQRVLNEEIVGYDHPSRMGVTFAPCGAIVNEFASHELKLRHIPPMLRGEHIWMQLLSEPGGGSDVAGAQTTATRDGDEWVLNGSKIWSSGAWYADYGLCLTRTNWDVEKHRGLSVFAVDLHQRGIEIHRIEMLNGARDFCQVFLTDVRIPDTERVSAVDDGWTVGIRWLFHERSLAAGSPYFTRPATGDLAPQRGTSAEDLVRIASELGVLGDPRVRDLLGEAHTLAHVGPELAKRIFHLIAQKSISDQAAAVSRLYTGWARARNNTIGLEIAGPEAVAWSADDDDIGQLGIDYLTRQAGSIGGGTVEMARNVISERVLGMPRERSGDRDIPFRDVPRSAPSR